MKVPQENISIGRSGSIVRIAPDPCFQTVRAISPPRVSIASAVKQGCLFWFILKDNPAPFKYWNIRHHEVGTSRFVCSLNIALRVGTRFNTLCFQTWTARFYQMTLGTILSLLSPNSSRCYKCERILCSTPFLGTG